MNAPGYSPPDPSPVRERGIASSLEMPEIAEAQALLAALGETDAVKADAARRERRAQLPKPRKVVVLRTLVGRAGTRTCNQTVMSGRL